MRGRCSAKHGKPNAVAPGALLRKLVTCIRVAHDPGRRVIPEHASDLFRGRRRAIGDQRHAGMLLIADPDAAAVME